MEGGRERRGRGRRRRGVRGGGRGGGGCEQLRGSTYISIYVGEKGAIKCLYMGRPEGEEVPFGSIHISYGDLIPKVTCSCSRN